MELGAKGTLPMGSSCSSSSIPWRTLIFQHSLTDAKSHQTPWQCMHGSTGSVSSLPRSSQCHALPSLPALSDLSHHCLLVVIRAMVVAGDGVSLCTAWNGLAEYQRGKGDVKASPRSLSAQQLQGWRRQNSSGHRPKHSHHPLLHSTAFLFSGVIPFVPTWLHPASLLEVLQQHSFPFLSFGARGTVLHRRHALHLSGRSALITHKLIILSQQSSLPCLYYLKAKPRVCVEHDTAQQSK